MNLYSIHDLKSMEVIDVNTGSKLGFIRDLIIDCENYKILSLIIPKMKDSWFSRNNNIEIEWKDVVKVGTDVILVKLDNETLEYK